MYQKVIVVGNLGADPTVREVGEGKVANFSLGTNRRWNNRAGEAQEETVWFRVSVWGKQADAVSRYLTKGRQVLVEGRLKADPETGGPRIWDGESGPRASFELTAETVRFLSGGARDEESVTASSNESWGQDDDMPF